MRSPGFRLYFVRFVYAMMSIFASMMALLALDILFVLKKPHSDADTLPIHKSEPATSAPFSESMRPAIQAKHVTPGKRLVAFVSVPVLIAIIATTFLFSVRYYSGILSQAAPVVARADTPKSKVMQPVFERGIIYPRWNATAYSNQDTVWQQALAPIKMETGAQWIELPVLFSQAAPSSTTVEVSQSAPNVQSFREGIQRAHALGYRVFFVPLMQVRISGDWSGSITFNTEAQEQQWFDSYWQAIQPYVVAAAATYVEQLAIGTELQTLQLSAPDRLWNQLIARIQGVFTAPLTYDMNWSSLAHITPSWFKNPGLTYIGVSSYIPLTDTAVRLDPGAMPALWQQKIGKQLDKLSLELKKRVLISEIGYRNSADALYHTWEATSKAKPDPAEQAGAYNATLANVLNDTHIAGTFFWGWDDVGMFAIAQQPAVQVLQKWYTQTHR